MSIFTKTNPPQSFFKKIVDLTALFLPPYFKIFFETFYILLLLHPAQRQLGMGEQLRELQDHLSI